MAYNTGEEKSAPMTWVALAGDVHNEVLMHTKVQIPDPEEMYDELIDIICESTDPRIRSVLQYPAWGTVSKIVKDGPWMICTNDQNTLLLYKLWYDCITLRMGMKPQVIVRSEQKPNGMPNHWVYVHTPELVWTYDSDQDVLYNEDNGIRIEYMPSDTEPEVPDWTRHAVRGSSREFSNGVNKLTYDTKGQCETNTLIAKQVWESLNEF